MWFAVTDYIRLNFLIIFVAFLFSLLNNKRKFFLVSQKNTRIQRISLLVLLTIITLSFVWNLNYNYQNKIISNYLGTIAILFFLYFCYSSLVQNYLSIELGILGLAYGGILLMSIVTIDSILVNFCGIEIHDFFVFGHAGNTSYFYRSLWISPCSPTEEPGAAALFLNILFPFTFYKMKGFKRIVSVCLYFFCLFSLFSTTGLVTFLIIIAILSSIYSKLNYKFLIFFSLFLGVVVLLSVNSIPMLEEIGEQWAFIDKITFSGNTVSDSERQEQWFLAIRDGFDSPFLGQGPGYGKATYEVSYLSTFLMFLGNYGIIAFLAFVLFWLTFIYKSLKLVGPIRVVFICSIVSCTIAAAIGEIMHSFILWVLLPIINKVYNEQAICRKLHKK